MINVPWRGNPLNFDTEGCPMQHKRASQTQANCYIRVVFKWLSKVITWLRLLRLVIGLKDSRQFFKQWESKPKPIAPRTRDLSRASSELPVIARNCDWFIALPAPVVIDRSNCFALVLVFRQSFQNGSNILTTIVMMSKLTSSDPCVFVLVTGLSWTHSFVSCWLFAKVIVLWHIITGPMRFL